MDIDIVPSCKRSVPGPRARARTPLYGAAQVPCREVYFILFFHVESDIAIGHYLDYDIVLLLACAISCRRTMPRGATTIIVVEKT